MALRTTYFVETFDDFLGGGFAPDPAAGQLDSDFWRVTGLSDGDGAFGGTFTTGDFARGVSAGGETTGGIWGFGLGGGNTGLGVQPAGSDFTPGTIELRWINDSGAALGALAAIYDLWANNDQTRANGLAFSFSTDGSTFTDIPALAYTSAEAADANGFQLVGDDLTAELQNVVLAPGEALYLRWQGDDVSGAGSRDEFALDDVRIVGEALAAPGLPEDLFISEYVEGSSNNKALEFFNGTGAAIDLSAGAYSVEFYFNGSASPGTTIALSGTVADGDVFVLADNDAEAAILAVADQTSTASFFNGDDAIVLKKNGTIIDVIGQIGVDPGTEWTGGGIGTQDETLRRKDTVIEGDADGSDAFDPSVEWVGFPTNTFDGLGSHSIAAPPGGETLSLSVTPDTLSEDGGTATGTVTRSGDTSAALVVTLGTSDGGEASAPATVTIEAGQASAQFTVTGVPDGVVDGDQPVTVEASAPGFAAATAAITVTDVDVPAITKIHEIQGSGSETPLLGQTVTVEAIVVGDYQGSAGLRGFYLQEEDADADGDATTSEGIFVFDGSGAVNVFQGDLVRVTGVAGEFSGQTQIGSVTSVEVLSSGNALPTPGVLDLPADDAAREALEGMLVRIPDKAFITEYFNYDRFGEIVVSVDDPATNQPGTDGRLDQFTQFNAPDAAGFAAYQEAIAARRITLDDGRNPSNPSPALLPDGTPFAEGNAFRGGDTLEDFGGVLGFGFGAWRLQPATAVFDNTITSENPRPEAPDDVGGTLKVASLNVLNFFTTLDVPDNPGSGPNGLDPRGADNPEEFDRQLEKLLTALNGIDADILGLVELENEFGGDQNGDGRFAIDTLVTEYNARYGTAYAFVDPGTPFVDTGDAISVGFIYDTTTVELAAGTTVEALTDADLAGLGLSASLPVFDGPDTNRASLAATFTQLATGESVTLAVNHFKSKGGTGTGADADKFDGQGAFNATRVKGAEALAAWLETDPTGSGDADYMILGDLNAYAMEDPVQLLKDAGYTDLVGQFVGPEAYSFVFDGQFGTLDYALANESLLAQVTGATEWRVNSDEPDIIDYDTSFKQPAEDALFDGTIPFRNSDHDPIIVGLDLTAPEPETVLARLDIENRFWGDRAVYSLDGEVVSVDRLRLLQKEVVLDEAGIVIGADDGLARSPEFVTTLGDGLGVRSVIGDRFWRGERKFVDDAETLSFDFEPSGTVGDALDIALEFGTVRGNGQVSLAFYDDGVLVESASVDIAAKAASYDLAGTTSYDRVEIGATGNLRFTIDAIEVARLVPDDAFAIA